MITREPRFIRPFTAAEYRVVRLVGSGVSYKRAATMLHCRPIMIRIHVSRAADKLAESGLAPLDLTPQQRVWWWYTKEIVKATYGKRPPG